MCDGALPAAISSVFDCVIAVAASVGPRSRDYAKWLDHKPLRIGDKITIGIRESDSADEPLRFKDHLSEE